MPLFSLHSLWLLLLPIFASSFILKDGTPWSTNSMHPQRRNRLNQVQKSFNKENSENRCRAAIHHSRRRRATAITTLSFFQSDRYHHSSETTTINQSIPFLIEKLPPNPSNLIYPEIANMCIDAFFNDHHDKHSFIPLWKQIQLDFLRRLQTADLERRRHREPNSNIMLLAREVLPATKERTAYTPLILNMENIVHRERLPTNDVVRGRLLGFVEVTLKPYGLPHDTTRTTTTTADTTIIRPVLTNLSVVSHARRSGVGSALMRTCEETVFNVWNEDEIILEVEEDNHSAIAFYQKRGYETLFSDNAARRYDVSGFTLQQKRCTRLVMRKRLGHIYNIPAQPVLSVLQTLRDTYRAVVEIR